MTPNILAPNPVDWLARRAGSVIDFRLPGDPHALPGHVMRARIAEYYAQLRRAGESPKV